MDKVYLSPLFAEHGYCANDGSVTIMQGDGDDAIPVLTVLLQANVKRGEKHKAKDPARDAFAAFVVKAINDAIFRGERP